MEDMLPRTFLSEIEHVIRVHVTYCKLTVKGESGHISGSMKALLG
jgi:hypothetical protein